MRVSYFLLLLDLAFGADGLNNIHSKHLLFPLSYFFLHMYRRFFVSFLVL